MRLETKRLILRPFRDADAADVFAYAKNPAVGPAAGWPSHKDEAESLQIIRTVFAAPNVFAVELRETGRVIGSVGFIDEHPRGVQPNCPDDELGYALDETHWGRGLMPEAAEAVMEYGFAELGFRRIWCSHYMENDRSRRVIEKLGFQYQFTRKVDVPLLGEVHQARYYLMEKEGWRGRLPDSLPGR